MNYILKISFLILLFLFSCSQPNDSENSQKSITGYAGYSYFQSGLGRFIPSSIENVELSGFENDSITVLFNNNNLREEKHYLKRIFTGTHPLVFNNNYEFKIKVGAKVGVYSGTLPDSLHFTSFYDRDTVSTQGFTIYWSQTINTDFFFISAYLTNYSDVYFDTTFISYKHSVYLPGKLFKEGLTTTIYLYGINGINVEDKDEFNLSGDLKGKFYFYSRNVIRLVGDSNNLLKISDNYKDLIYDKNFIKYFSR